jgi:hypothetical protein
VSRVFIVGGFKEFHRALLADDWRAAENFGRLTRLRESHGDFGFDGVHQQTAANGRAGGDAQRESRSSSFVKKTPA